MSERDNRPIGQEGDVRVPRPESAAQDPQNAATQEQVKRDAQANREQQERVNASVPPEVRDRPVGEIVRDAEQRAERDRQR
jgi:hypothetical protein